MVRLKVSIRLLRFYNAMIAVENALKMFPTVQYIELRHRQLSHNEILEKKITDLEKRVAALEKSRIVPWNPSMQARNIFVKRLLSIKEPSRINAVLSSS